MDYDEEEYGQSLVPAALEYLDPAELSYQEWVDVGMGLVEQARPRALPRRRVRPQVALVPRRRRDLRRHHRAHGPGEGLGAPGGRGPRPGLGRGDGGRLRPRRLEDDAPRAQGAGGAPGQRRGGRHVAGERGAGRAVGRGLAPRQAAHRVPVGAVRPRGRGRLRHRGVRARRQMDARRQGDLHRHGRGHHPAPGQARRRPQLHAGAAQRGGGRVDPLQPAGREWMQK